MAAAGSRDGKRSSTNGQWQGGLRLSTSAGQIQKALFRTADCAGASAVAAYKVPVAGAEGVRLRA